jgi:outer membrane protein TolC
MNVPKFQILKLAAMVCAAAFGLLPLSPQAAEAPKIIFAQQPGVILGGQTYGLGEALRLVLTRNKTVLSAAYDLAMADTAYQKFLSKYGLSLNASARQGYQQLPGLLALTGGDEQYSTGLEASLEKNFASGTGLTAGYSHDFADTRFDPGSPLAASGFSFVESKYHQSRVFVTLRQDLLKNSFGISEQRGAAMLENEAEIQKQMAIHQLAGLAVKTITDYWRLEIAAQQAANAAQSLRETTRLKNTVASNVRLGTADGYQLNFYNSLEAAAQIARENADTAYQAGLREFLATLGISREAAQDALDTVILADDVVLENIETLQEQALKGRGDLRAVRLMARNAELAEKNALREFLPSLQLEGTLASLGRRATAGDSLGDLGAGEYPAYQARLTLTAPLSDTGRRADLRNARFRMLQADIRLKQAEESVAREVLNQYEAVESMKRVAALAKTARAEAEKAFAGMTRRFETGQLSLAAVKDALDVVIQARGGEIQALAGFNMAVLQLDIATNSLWRRFGIEVDDYIPTGEEE